MQTRRNNCNRIFGGGPEGVSYRWLLTTGQSSGDTLADEHKFRLPPPSLELTVAFFSMRLKLPGNLVFSRAKPRERERERGEGMKCEATPPLINVFIDKVLPERKLKHFEEEVIHARFIRFSRFPIIRRRVCINTTPVCNSVRASAFFAQQVVECIMVEKREEGRKRRIGGRGPNRLL